MAADYYKTLGVERSATPEEIQKAYRKLARKHHPDMNPDDKTAKQKFQEVQAAFEVLNDPKKRKLYDEMGSAAFEGGGAGPGPRGGFNWQGAPGGFENVDLSDLFGGGGGGFADFFQQMNRGRAPGGRRQRRAATPSRGADIEAQLEIPLNVAVNGGEQQFTLSRDGKQETIAVKIPPGIDDGKKIRLRAQGQPSAEGGPPGDLLLVVQVAPHPHYQRKGNDLHLRLPITLREAVEGAKVDIPTPGGTVSLRIPAGSSSGKKLRVKGQGVASLQGTGDLYVELQIVLPEQVSDAEREWIRQFDERHPLTPRDRVRW